MESCYVSIQPRVNNLSSVVDCLLISFKLLSRLDELINQYRCRRRWTNSTINH